MGAIMFNRSTFKHLLPICLLIVLLLTMSAPSSAQVASPLGRTTNPNAADAQVIEQLHATRPQIQGLSGVSASAFAPSEEVSGGQSFVFPTSGPVSVIIEMDAAPASSSAANPAAAAGAIQSVAQAQGGTIAAVQSFGGQVTGGIQYLANMIFADVDASNIQNLLNLPGVKNVYLNRQVFPTNETSVPFIGSAAFWDPVLGTGLTGQGMTVAIIDTGINYPHLNFGACGFDGTNFTGANCKVVGGYDFIDNDNDPLDTCNGHGTHVAGSAAGYGVFGGATYFGPYDATTPFDTMDIGPGVAPEANILSYKVLACVGGGTFAGVIMGIEQAVLDGADVMNMSLGAPFGSPVDADPTAPVIEAAVNAGVIVVISAGNEGDTHYVVGIPGATPHSITVAATVDAGIGLPRVGVNSPFTATYTEVRSAAFGPPLSSTGPITGNLVTAVDGTGNANDACQALTNGAAMAGNIAFIRRGSCNFVVKVKNAQNAGAVAALVWDVGGVGLTVMGGTDPTIVIASVLIDQAGGTAINTALGGGAVNVTLFEENAGDTVSDFTSRGPARGPDVRLKPDLSAPGVSILSSYIPNADSTGLLQGTSMAAPHVTGMMALLSERYPAWTPEELKALAMNTAVDLYELPFSGGERFSPARTGAGRVNLNNILNMDGSEAIAYNHDDPEQVSVSFGAVEVVDTVNLNRIITIENKSDSSQSFSIDGSVDIVDSTAGVSFAVSPNSLNLGPGQSGNITVSLSANAHDMYPDANAPDPTMPDVQNNLFGNFPRLTFAEVSGFVNITNDNNVDMRVPVYAALRQASDMQAQDNVAMGPDIFGTTLINLEGDDLDGTQSGHASDVVSLVTAFQHALEDPQDFAGIGQDFADIQHVGVTDDLYAGGTRLYFGISTFGMTNTPNEVYFTVNLDCDEDGTADANATNVDLAFFFGLNPNPTDTHWVWYDVDGDGFPNWDTTLPVLINEQEVWLPLDLYNFNTNVIVIPFELGFLVGGGGPCDPIGAWDYNFDFWVDTNTWDLGPLDITDTASYDIINAPYSFNDLAGTFGGPYTNMPVWGDLNDDALPVDYYLPGYANGDPLPDIMLIHHQNSADAGRVQILSAEFTDRADVGIEKTVDNAEPGEGDTITYTVTVTNNGPASVYNVVVEDQLPAGVTLVSETCSTQGGVYTVGVPGISPEVCDLTGFGILPGDSFEFDITVSVDAGTDGTAQVNVAEISDFSALSHDTNADNNTAAVTVCVGGASLTCTPGVNGTGAAAAAADGVAGVTGEGGLLNVFDPAISKIGFLTAGQIGVGGEQLEWITTVTNTGGVAGTNIVVQDDVRPELRIDTVEVPAGASYTVNGQLVTVTIPTLAAGQSVQFSIFTTVISGGVRVDNQACLTAGNFTGELCAFAPAPVAALPATGETPFWRTPLLAALALLGVGLMLVGGFRTRRR